jgi:hypothetical protein
MEAYNLPIKLREWFVHRLKQQKDEENEAIKAQNKAQTTSSGPKVLDGTTTPPPRKSSSSS